MFSTEARDVMTPRHPDWEWFCAELDRDIRQHGCSGDGSQLDPATGKTAPQEQPTHWLSRRLLIKTGCDVEASLAYFREHGGYCDCEVLLNVDPDA